MNKRKIFLLFLVLTLVLSSILTGCGKNNKLDESKADTNEHEEKFNDVEQYLKVILDDEPSSLDVAKGSDGNSGCILAEVMESLTRLEQDENGNDIIQKAGAESWETSEDGLVWTFHLRDFNWTDGKPVTAEDYVYGVKRTLDPNTASPCADLLMPIKNAEAILNGTVEAEKAGIEAVDDKTLKVTLEYPCAYFLSLTYSRVMQPQRKDIIEQHGDTYGTEPETMVFCGPFIIKEWVHNSKVILAKNDSYWDKDSVKLDKIEMKIIDDENATMGELLNGSLDIAGVYSAEWTEKLDESGKFNTSSGFEPTTTYMFFNQEDKLFSNANVRRAFSVALDREKIQKDIFNDTRIAAYGWIAPPVYIDGENFREKCGDPIKELLEENKDPKELLIKGLKELGMDEDPSKITITVLQPSDSNGGKIFGEYLQQELKQKLGINVELERVEWPVFQDRTRDLDYQVAYKSWGGGYNDPMSFLELWVSGCTIVRTGWSNEKYDNLIKLASTSIDSKERLEAFKEAERILIKDESTIIPYAYWTKNTYMHKNVKGVMCPAFGDMELKYAYIE